MIFQKLTALLVIVLMATATEAQSWPDKSIKLLSPSTPGGPPDVYARALAEHMSKALGQPLVVENVPAGGGLIAAQQLMRAPADGYTLLVNTAGMMTITPNANPRAQYKAADFTQICQGVDAALVLAGNAQLGLKDYHQLVQWIKSQKTPPTYSSYSPGSPAHFLGYQLSESLAVDMVHVPYKSSPPQISDMLGAIAPLGFVQIATAAPHIKSGKLVAYASTGEKRSSQLPEIPTVAELGMPQLTTSVWFGLSAPKGLAQNIVQRLTALHQQMTASPEFKTRMAASGLNPTPDICGLPFLSKINQESERWARVVKVSGFSATD